MLTFNSPLPSLPHTQIEDNIVEMKRKASSRTKMERKMHSQLKIIGGSVTGRYLVSSQGAQTRPMMEKVGGLGWPVLGLGWCRVGAGSVRCCDAALGGSNAPRRARAAVCTLCGHLQLWTM